MGKFHFPHTLRYMYTIAVMAAILAVTQLFSDLSMANHESLRKLDDYTYGSCTNCKSAFTDIIRGQIRIVFWPHNISYTSHV